MLFSKKAVELLRRRSKTELLIILRPYVLLLSPTTPTSTRSNARIRFLTFQHTELAEGFECGLIASEERIIYDPIWGGSVSRKIQFVSKRRTHQLEGKRKRR